jgi:hypothetical protein
MSTVGLHPSFVTPAAAHSHPDCRAILILIVAPHKDAFPRFLTHSEAASDERSAGRVRHVPPSTASFVELAGENDLKPARKTRNMTRQAAGGFVYMQYVTIKTTFSTPRPLLAKTAIGGGGAHRGYSPRQISILRQHSRIEPSPSPACSNAP